METIEQIYRHCATWDEINWSQTERDVRRLQGRIFRASSKNDTKRVNNLMKLLVRSMTAKLLAIYTITQRNKGRFTPGIDGKVYLTSKERIELLNENFDYRTYKFQPIVRKNIPKSNYNWRLKVIPDRALKFENSEMRPLGILNIKDRIMATILSYALAAKWEALFEPDVMGFRPGRCTQDAIQRIFLELSKRDKFVLDADISQFFDNIKHSAILDKINPFRKALFRCLTAGVIDGGKRVKTVKGIAQGSPLSPVLANIALSGMQETLGRDICAITYADDLIIIAPTWTTMKQVNSKLNNFLKDRGLQLKREKTQITNRKLGFNFLGFTIDQPRAKLYVKPQKEKVNKFLNTIREILWSNKQMEQRKLIAKLNPIIRGWAMYYRYSDANKTFNQVDHEIFNLLWRWAKRRHSDKSKTWIYNRYFTTTEDRKWIFQDKKTGYTITRASYVLRLQYAFTVNKLSPLDPNQKVRELWQKRRKQELRHALI